MARLEALDWHYTPLEVLEVDERYPGLWEDIDTVRWQNKLADEQMNGKKGG